MKIFTALQKQLLTTGALTALLVSSLRTEACTAFQFSSGNRSYLAKNYDFMMGEGLLIVNRRGMAKRSATTARSFEWVSRYGSVTYNQFGREMPNAGMNEAGLVVEMLWLNETKYAPPDSRSELGALQWIQYQLDTAHTVADVIASDKAVRIADDVGQVHFLISDQAGGVAVLEYLEGKLQIHSGADLPIPAVANDVYAACVKALENTSPNDDPRNAASALPSFGRFQSVARQLGKYDASRETPEEFALGALQKVRHARYTQWQVVYDMTKLRLFLRRIVDETVREVDFAACDFSPRSTTMAADLTKRGPLTWVECTPELNRAVLRKSYAQTPFLQHVGEAELNEIAAIAESFLPANTTAALRKIN